MKTGPFRALLHCYSQMPDGTHVVHRNGTTAELIRGQRISLHSSPQTLRHTVDAVRELRSEGGGKMQNVCALNNLTN